MALKHDKPRGGTPPSKKTKDKEGTSCILCISCSKNADEGSIQCESCFKWEHRECAGVTTEEFAVITDCSPNIKFFCSSCRPKVTMALNFFKDVREKQDLLDKRIQEIEDKLKNEKASAPQSASPVPSPTTRLPSVTSLPDKKFNVVVYGIPESPPNTDRPSHQKHDVEHVLKSLSDIDDEIKSSAFKDIYRLGKFRDNRTKPRPLLVKFLRSIDISNVLRNKSKLKSGIFLKPDLSADEQAKESLLLKERWSLIQKGVERKRIKLRNFSIFVDNQTHCKVEGSQLVFKSPSSKVLPRTTNFYTQNNSNLISLHNNPDSSHNLKIISLNCRSIRSASKRANLLVLLNEHKADIVIGCESHLDETFNSSEILPSAYNIFRRDRTLGGGGVFIGVKNHLTATVESLSINSDAEFIWMIRNY